MRINYRELKSITEVFRHLNNLCRWTSFSAQSKYNELAKQALNCITSYILASYAENSGKTVRWDRFPKIAIYRAFQKAYVYFDTPEHIIDELCALGNIPRDLFDKTTKEIIAEKTDQSFADYISEGVGTFEMEIFQAATKVATMIELLEIGTAVTPQFHITKTQQISKNIEAFSHIPGVREISDCHSGVFQALQIISTLRNRTRWASHSYSIECSVLGHLFDTAVFAYFMSLEQDPDNEDLATKMFWLGVFHDVAETWTSDIPSPIKNRIPNFRKATELYELQKLEDELLNRVPPFLAQKLQSVMFEGEENQKYKKLLKGADYLSADSECWRQYVAGTRDTYFLAAIEDRLQGIISGNTFLPPTFQLLFDDFLKDLRKLL